MLKKTARWSLIPDTRVMLEITSGYDENKGKYSSSKKLKTGGEKQLANLHILRYMYKAAA